MEWDSSFQSPCWRGWHREVPEELLWNLVYLDHDFLNLVKLRKRGENRAVNHLVEHVPDLIFASSRGAGSPPHSWTSKEADVPAQWKSTASPDLRRAEAYRRHEGGRSWPREGGRKGCRFGAALGHGRLWRACSAERIQGCSLRILSPHALYFVGHRNDDTASACGLNITSLHWFGSADGEN
jgi:hypothetical protein